MTAPVTDEDVVAVDVLDARRVARANGLLGRFNAAGVLAPADVHVAAALGRLVGETSGAVLLAAALAVRAPRLGHVCTDLSTARTTVTVDKDIPVDVQALPWPDPGGWPASLADSALVSVGSQGPAGRPLRLVGTLLYLDRYWWEERRVAADLTARNAMLHEGVSSTVLREGLDRLFDGAPPDLQRLAAATAVLRRFTVVAGGPGTGKTTTVARILALLDDQAAAAGTAPPRVALAAPTGKAAARLEEAVHAEAARLDVPADVRHRLLGSNAATLHRLLGWRPGSRSRFQHHRGNRLPHDVVIVDETSMVSLSLMARLVEAVRDGARLVLVGDPDQLASVEAGAVLGDVVGAAKDGMVLSPPAREALTVVTGHEPPALQAPAHRTFGDGVVVLRRVHRFRADSGIAALSRAVHAGDEDTVIAVLSGDWDDVQWIPVDAARDNAPAAMGGIRDVAVDTGRRVTQAARAGHGLTALEALNAFRLLCAHRHGPYGVARWAAQIQGWLASDIDDFAAGGEWYVGRPLLVTQNDYGLRLFNGDTGVVVAGDDGAVTAAFERRGELIEVSPTLLSAVETVYAMTVHKSQGSQFDGVAVLLPEPESPILTRELLYTAVTRSSRRLMVVGAEASVRRAVATPITRASGLRAALWGT